MKLKNYFTLSEIIDTSKKYVVGVSGGPDSTFLLYHLINLLPSSQLVVAHVNYNLRESASTAAAMVEKICVDHKITFFKKDLVKNNTVRNIEDWARAVRYQFFVAITKQEQCDAILIAHTYDDDIETYALQKQRQNLVTYYGLKQVSTYEHIAVIRPMLEVTKQQVLQWLAENRIPFDIDVTNDDLSFARNKIRATMTPEIATLLQKERDSKNRMMKMVYMRIEPILTSTFHCTEFVKLNDKEELVFVFEYLKRFIPHWDIKKMKKNICSEIAKQLRSEKAYIRIVVNKDYALIKDRDIVTFEKLSHLNQCFEITTSADFAKLDHFENKVEIILAFQKTSQPLIVRNDFLQYQTQLDYRGKLIKKWFLSKKTSYLWKIRNAVYYLKNTRNILNISIEKC